MKEGSSFIRWQNISINQLGFTSNLIFTINLVILGFLVNKIIDNNFVLACEGKALFTIGLFILILGFLAGIIINLTRLYDFRLTAKTARKREKNKNNPELSELRESTSCLGKATWIIFNIQMILLGLGLISILISLILLYSDKLF